MNFFKKLFGKSRRSVPEPEPTLSQETESEAGQSILPDNIYPLIKKIEKGDSSTRTVITVEGKEYEMPESSLPVSEPIANTELALFFVIDKGSHYEYVQNKSLGEESKEKLTGKAYQRLLSDLTELGIGQIEQEGLENSKVGIMVNTNGLASSLILVENIWENIFQFCGSEVVAFTVPNQDRFLFCRLDDEKGREFLRSMSEMLIQSEQKPLSVKLYRKFKGKTIEPLPD